MLRTVTIFKLPSHYSIVVVDQDGSKCVLFDDGTVRLVAMIVSDNGYVTFTGVAHRQGVTEVSYELKQGDEANRPESPADVTDLAAEYKTDFDKECAVWKVNDLQLKPVAEQCLKVYAGRLWSTREGRRITY